MMKSLYEYVYIGRISLLHSFPAIFSAEVLILADTFLSDVLLLGS